MGTTREMQSDTFRVKSQELHAELTCKLLKLPRGLFIWVGQDDALGSMSVAIPSRDHRDGKSSLSSIVIADSSAATQLASRLAKMYKVQVFVAGNLGEDCDIGWRLVEERLKEESICRPELFACTTTT